MSDRSWAQITFGGPIKASDLEDLAKVIDDEGLGASQFNDGTSTLDGLREQIDAGAPQSYEAGEATGGFFEQLEAKLTDLGLTWRRLSSGCEGVYNGEIVCFRPTTGLREMICPETGSFAITIDELRSESGDMTIAAVLAKIDEQIFDEDAVPPLTLAAGEGE